MKIKITENQFKRLFNNLFGNKKTIKDPDPKKDIFVPHNIEGRDEQRLQMIKRKLNKKIIEGDLNLKGIPITDLGNVEEINGNLSLWENKILKSLGKLKRVNGWLNLTKTNIEDLGNLEYVGNDLSLYGNKTLKSLGKLKKVNGWLDLRYTNIEDLGNLEYVGKSLWLRKSKLSKLYSEEEIRKIITVGGRIHF